MVYFQFNSGSSKLPAASGKLPVASRQSQKRSFQKELLYVCLQL